jgi:hypothetical protein
MKELCENFVRDGFCEKCEKFSVVMWEIDILVTGPGNSKLGLRTTVAIIIARLLLVPPVGLGIVTLADKLGFIPADDKMFRFVLLLQHTMPTSILAG